MKRLLAITALGFTLVACGSVADLKPQAGKSLPPKPALAREPLTADQLLQLPTGAKLKRVDELSTRGEVRKPDRFDLPPPDGVAVPPPEGTDEPSTPSTTGPDNEDEPR